MAAATIPAVTPPCCSVGTSNRSAYHTHSSSQIHQSNSDLSNSLLNPTASSSLSRGGYCLPASSSTEGLSASSQCLVSRKTLTSSFFGSSSQLERRDNQLAARVSFGRRYVKRRRRLQVCAAQESPYDVLGVSRTATEKQIKAAYRKLALKFHPDVNKAPDAQAQFLRIKNAYQTLTDPQSRSKQERAASAGTGTGNWTTDFDPFGWAGGKSGGKRKEDEEFYGFEDFFRDLSKDFEKRRESTSSGKPKSLWEELKDIGEEFVEFLEKNLPEEPSASRVKSEYEDFAARSEKKEYSAKNSSGSTASSSSSTTNGASSRQEPKKSPDKDIDDMLANLKKELGL